MTDCKPRGGDRSPEANRTCPSCGCQFGCHIASGRSTCWCFELPRVPIDSSVEDCLCPDCLQSKIADHSSKLGSAKQNGNGA